MDFEYMEDDQDLHSVRLIALTLRKERNAIEPERKRLMKEARESGDTIVHQLMLKSRPPAWYSIMYCSECPQFGLISANDPQASRFKCGGCGGGVSVEWTEEHARDKVHEAHRKHIEKEMEKKPEIGGWESKARKMHERQVKKNGCSIKKQKTNCDWCKPMSGL